MGFSLSGLASGLDTTSLIEQLIELERTPVYREQSKIETYEYEQAVFRSINTKLLSLRTAASDLMLNATFNLTSATNSDDTVAKITAEDSASAGSYEIDITQIAKSHVLQSDEIASDDVNATLDGKTFTIYHENLESPLVVTVSGNDIGEMMQSIADQINGEEAGLTASVIETSPGNKRLVFSASGTGEENSINIDNAASAADGSKVTINDSNGVLSALGLDLSNEAQAYQNAKFSVNGVNIETSNNTTSDVIEGVKIDLIKTGTTSVSVSKDADKVADKVEAFVNAYNSVMQVIRDNTKKLDDSSTATNLQGDSTLRSLQSSLENWTTGRVADGIDGYHLLSDLGIEADKGITSASAMTGLLSFDRETFIEKFNENPSAVKHLFNYDDTSSDNEDGFGRLLDDALPDWTSSVDGIISSRIKGYDALIEDSNDRIDRIEDSILLKEEQLKSQFTAMEVALATLQNQQAWMTSQLASLSTSY